jgi:hypothetical protein
MGKVVESGRMRWLRLESSPDSYVVDGRVELKTRFVNPITGTVQTVLGNARTIQTARIRMLRKIFGN